MLESVKVQFSVKILWIDGMFSAIVTIYKYYNFIFLLLIIASTTTTTTTLLLLLLLLYTEYKIGV